MNSSIISKVARPTVMSISKRSFTRTFVATPARQFYNEEPKAHHQVAPLTESTVYAPQGHTTAAESAATTTSASEPVVFSPTVNHVFDD